MPRKARKAIRLSGMSSTLNRAIAASFARSTPSHEVDVTAFGLNADSCIWCGAPATCTDHLFGLTVNKRWSGHAEVLVPACDPCNEGRKRNDDPIASIEASTRIADKGGAAERLRKVMATTPRVAALPPEATEEQAALYAEFDELWSKLKALDGKVHAWAERWGPSMVQDTSADARPDSVVVETLEDDDDARP